MSKEAVYGPTKHGNKWRLEGRRADGGRFYLSFATVEEADEAKRGILSQLATCTVRSSVTTYLQWLKDEGRKPTHLASARYRLLAFFQLRRGDLAMHSLTTPRCLTFYQARVAKVKPTTHHNELAQAKTFCDWLVKTGKLATNPVKPVESVGRKTFGADKTQLRVEEARRLLATCLSDPAPSALATALALLTGARASEIMDRTVRDVDDGGALLWVDYGKTRAAARPLTIAIPEVRARLRDLAANREPTELLWGPERDRQWLYYHVLRLCKLAKVPAVGPHGLRRTHATLALISGVAAEVVAAELGQEGPEVTRTSYFARGSEREAQSKNVAGRLERGPFKTPSTLHGRRAN